MGPRACFFPLSEWRGEKKKRPREVLHADSQSAPTLPLGGGPHALSTHTTRDWRERTEPAVLPGPRVTTVSLSVSQQIVGCVGLLYPARRQPCPDSRTGLRSRSRAVRVGLMKFISPNEGATYPVIQPGERAPASQRLPENTQTQPCGVPHSNDHPSGSGVCLQAAGEGRGKAGFMGCIGLLCP